MKKLAVLAVILVAAYFGGIRNRIDSGQPGTTVSEATDSEQVLIDAFAAHRSDLHVQIEARVLRTLSDDTSGSRHQRFLIELSNGQTVLVAHNIDLADRVDSLKSGDLVELNGEYEWNDKGGVIHWTHRDPAGKHPAGWIKHNGRAYQ